MRRINEQDDERLRLYRNVLNCIEQGTYQILKLDRSKGKIEIRKPLSGGEYKDFVVEVREK